MTVSAPDDNRLLAALALALVQKPRASLQELAKAVGISKATLYRFCRTREELIDRLMAHGTALLHATADLVEIEEGSPIQVLPKLIAAQLEHRELMAFMIYYWRPDALDNPAQAAQWDEFTHRMDAFFLRGQREGVFRIDISAAALSEAFGGLFCGLVDAERNGRVARTSIAPTLAALFLKGASA